MMMPQLHSTPVYIASRVELSQEKGPQGPQGPQEVRTTSRAVLFSINLICIRCLSTGDSIIK